MVHGANFEEAFQVHWDGNNLTNRLGYKMKCIKQVDIFKVYVNKSIGGDGSAMDSEYFVVNTEINTVARYVGDATPGLASEIIKFLEYSRLRV